MTKQVSKSGLAAAIALIMSVQASAQQNYIEEIVVTAQKRAENVQDIPIAIAAYSGNALQESGIENSLDLQMIDPSLVITTNTAAGQPYLRGVGTDVATPGLESSIATFVDDVYMSRSTAALQDFFDIQRIDVVKGPQGVLFGRNAVGGAVNIYTNKPSDELEFGASVTVGNYNKKRIEAMVNVPIVEDKVNFRLSGLSSKRDGYFNNIAGADLENDDFQALRAQLAINVSDNMDVLIAATSTREDSTRNLALWVDPELTTSPLITGAVRPTDTDVISINDHGYVKSDSDGVAITVNWDLENISIKSITAYRDTFTEINVDLDGTEFLYASNVQPINSQTTTQEIQIISNSDSDLTWVVGGFGLVESADQALNITLGYPGFDLLINPYGDVSTYSYGIFGNIRNQFSDEFALNVGLRYNADKRKSYFYERTLVASTSDVLAETTINLSGDYDDFTPRFVLEYTPSDDTLSYLSISKGYKAGGFNSIVAQESGVNPESVWAYELGLKTTLLDGRMQVNTAAFYYDYTDMQINTLPENNSLGYQIILNAGESVIKGIEFDVKYVPIDNLEFRLAGQLLDAEYKKLAASDGARTATDGNQMPRAPEISASMSIEYTIDIGDQPLKLRVDARHESEQYLDIFEDKSTQRDDNTVYNARATYDISEQVSVALWGRNLSDETVVQSALRADTLFGTAKFFGAPRTYGLTVDMRF